MARPTKFTPERAETILRALEAGNTRRCAAESAGVDYSTFLRWTERYASFATDVSVSEARAEQKFVAIVADAAQTRWQAAAFWLGRRRPGSWSPTRALAAEELTAEQAAELIEREGDGED